MLSKKLFLTILLIIFITLMTYTEGVSKYFNGVASQFDHQLELADVDTVSERYKRGAKLIGEVYGYPDAAERMMENFADIAPDMARYIIEFPYGDIYSRPGLDLKHRQIATVASLTAMGNAEPQLRTHIRASLSVGLTPEQIVETMLQMSLYAGFPASIRALYVARAVFEEDGIDFEPELTESKPNRFERGSVLIARVYGNPDAAENMMKNFADIAPDMARYIMEFPYGDVYSRDGLSLQFRQIATVAALTSMGNAEPQLRTHIRASLSVGLTQEQLVEAMLQMSLYAGFPASIRALYVAREVFNE